MMSPAGRTIPLVVLEEHHEAYYVWHHARKVRWLEDTGATLLHVDSHADLSLPFLREAPPCGTDLAETARFTYRELDINSFIWPAIHQGIFNRLLYLRYAHSEGTRGWRRLAIRSDGELGEHLVLHTLGPASWIGPSPADCQILDYARIVPQSHIDTDQPLILDIDLDYFCCNEYPSPAFNEIEITAATYDELEQNNYHCCRLAPSLKASVLIRQERYYLRFYDQSAQPASEDQQRAQIHDRLRDFISFLEQQSVQPVLISICRSHYSGYTPTRWVAYIEEELIRSLGALYILAPSAIHDLMAAGAALPSERRTDAPLPLSPALECLVGDARQ